MDLGKLLGLVAALITVFGFITKKGRAFMKRIWVFFTRYNPKMPRRTLKLIQQERYCRWSMGSINKKPAMQLISSWYVTNYSHGDVLICKVALKKPKTLGSVLVRHPDKDIYGSYPIPPGITTEAQVDFWIQPPRRKEDEKFIGSVEFIDQFGNPHLVRRIIFSPRPKNIAAEQERPQMEVVGKISSPIEKKVASVLQAEVYRYRECGRRVGGLGSIKSTYKGRVFSGVGSDSQIADSPDLQAVVSDPNEAKIESDNATTLINYFSTLADEEKAVFMKALLDRLSRDTVYAPVGYLILFVLLLAGNLRDALNKAKKDLLGDSAYGFSDMLRLLDGLLKYEYTIFTEEMLDDIDQFLEGIKEHTFRIPERTVALRSLLLAKKMESKSG